eukprot:jgi/Mesen1/7635/ME000004S07902
MDGDLLKGNSASKFSPDSPDPFFMPTSSSVNSPSPPLSSSGFEASGGLDAFANFSQANAGPAPYERERKGGVSKEPVSERPGSKLNPSNGGGGGVKEKPKAASEDRNSNAKAAGRNFDHPSRSSSEGLEVPKPSVLPPREAKDPRKFPAGVEEQWLTVEDILLTTDPMSRPPPSRPPPPVGAQRQRKSSIPPASPDRQPRRPQPQRRAEPASDPKSASRQESSQGPKPEPAADARDEPHVLHSPPRARRYSHPAAETTPHVPEPDVSELEEFGSGRRGGGRADPRQQQPSSPPKPSPDSSSSQHGSGGGGGVGLDDFELFAAGKKQHKPATPERVPERAQEKVHEHRAKSHSPHAAPPTELGDEHFRRRVRRPSPGDASHPGHHQQQGPPPPSPHSAPEPQPPAPSHSHPLPPRQASSDYDTSDSAAAAAASAAAMKEAGSGGGGGGGNDATYDFFNPPPPAHQRATPEPRGRSDTPHQQKPGPVNLDDLGSKKKPAPEPPAPAPAPPPHAAAAAGSAATPAKKASPPSSADDWMNVLGGASFQPGPARDDFADIPGESEERRKLRYERHLRSRERANAALDEKNRRDADVAREQAERDVLWPECRWEPISLGDLMSGAMVKKAYRKATLCVHPDKVQQKGATVQQKYIAEKVFDLLKESWNKFNSEELF